MSNIVSQIQAALEALSPIRKLSDSDLIREIAVLRPLYEAVVPKPVRIVDAPAAPSNRPPMRSVASPAAALRSQPLHKGSIYSRRPTAAPRAAAVAAPVTQVVAKTSPTALDATGVSGELLAQLKLRLGLCESERAGRERLKSGAKSTARPSRAAGEPKARKHAWSCAKDVMLDDPKDLVLGPLRVKPSSSGNWVRLGDLKTGQPAERGEGGTPEEFAKTPWRSFW